MQTPDRPPDEWRILNVDEATGEVKIVERWNLTPDERKAVNETCAFMVPAGCNLTISIVEQEIRRRSATKPEAEES